MILSFIFFLVAGGAALDTGSGTLCVVGCLKFILGMVVLTGIDGMSSLSMIFPLTTIGVGSLGDVGLILDGEVIDD